MTDISRISILRKRIPITITLFLLLSFFVPALPGAASEGPPCCPCIGATVDDPLVTAQTLAEGQILDDDSAIYIRWMVNPGDTGAAEGAAALVSAGARPWMMLRFVVPAPASGNQAALAAAVITR